MGPTRSGRPRTGTSVSNIDLVRAAPKMEKGSKLEEAPVLEPVSPWGKCCWITLGDGFAADAVDDTGDRERDDGSCTGDASCEGFLLGVGESGVAERSLFISMCLEPS